MLPENLLDKFRDENLCVQAYKEFRLAEGIVCKKCGHDQHYWLGPKQQFQCKKCRHRTTLQSDTVLHGSKLPLSYFFIAFYLLQKKGNLLTVDELQKATGHLYFEPLWVFLFKLKNYLHAMKGSQTVTILTDILNRYFG